MGVCYAAILHVPKQEETQMHDLKLEKATMGHVLRIGQSEFLTCGTIICLYKQDIR